MQDMEYTEENHRWFLEFIEKPVTKSITEARGLKEISEEELRNRLTYIKNKIEEESDGV